MKSLNSEENESKRQGLMNIFFSFLFFAVVAFISEIVGIGDWVRRNAVWFVLFAVGVVELDNIGTIQQLWRFIKNNSENEHKDLMEKIGKLTTDVDYIKITMKELKDEGVTK